MMMKRVVVAVHIHSCLRSFSKEKIWKFHCSFSFREKAAQSALKLEKSGKKCRKSPRIFNLYKLIFLWHVSLPKNSQLFAHFMVTVTSWGSLRQSPWTTTTSCCCFEIHHIANFPLFQLALQQPLLLKNEEYTKI